MPTSQTTLTYGGYTLPDGRRVVDEICICGHLRSEHGILRIQDNDNVYLIAGKGALGKCRRFRFKTMVFADEPAQTPKKKEPKPCHAGQKHPQKKKPPTRTESSARRPKARSSRSRPPRTS